MKKGDIQQQISEEQWTAVHDYSKFWFGFGNTRVVPKKKGYKVVYVCCVHCAPGLYTHARRWEHNNIIG